MSSSKQKTGLLFGSFDPVHTGHLIIANYMLSMGGLDEIWFVVSPQNPFKQEKQITDQQVRKQMLELAVAGNSDFKVSDIEFSMPSPNYTHNTLKVLMEKFTGKEFVLIIGTDNLQAFDKWKNYESILEMAHIWVYPRVGYKGERFTTHPSVRMTDAPVIEISSTIIRRSFEQGRPFRYMLPERVFEYINKKGLYRG
ncbi:MAG: nicotinate (nicotinamide) nucleotide adenylyltransferase [Bacteroidales bacterium]